MYKSADLALGTHADYLQIGLQDGQQLFSF